MQSRCQWSVAQESGNFRWGHANNGGGRLPRNRNSLMSDELKWELAKELGVDQIVMREGWGGVPSRDCGNLVRLAIQRAEAALRDGQPFNRYR